MGEETGGAMVGCGVATGGATGALTGATEGIGGITGSTEGSAGEEPRAGGSGMGGMKKLMGGLMGGGLAQMAGPAGPRIKTKGSGHMEKKDRNRKKKRR